MTTTRDRNIPGGEPPGLSIQLSCGARPLSLVAPRVTRWAATTSRRPSAGIPARGFRAQHLPTGRNRVRTCPAMLV
jgi:hypothetical protein